MDEIRIYQTAELLKAIASPIRLKILLLLARQGSQNVTAIQGNLQVEQSLLSHHLIKMKDKGVLTCRRRSKEIYYEVNEWLLKELTPLLSERLGNDSAES